MPPQTFFSGGWAGRKWATDHHRRSLPFKKQHKSKDEIFKCLKGAKSVKSGAEDTGPVTCLQPAILRVKSEKKPHVTSIPSLGFYRKIAKLFSKEKKVQINFSSMFYCILATFSFYFLPSPPQSSLFEASHRQDPQASFSLLHPFLLGFDTVDLLQNPLFLWFPWCLSVILPPSHTLSDITGKEPSPPLFPKLFLKCQLQLPSPLRCSVTVSRIWRRQGSHFHMPRLSGTSGGNHTWRDLCVPMTRVKQEQECSVRGQHGELTTQNPASPLTRQP